MMQYWNINKKGIRVIGHEREEFGNKYSSVKMFLQPNMVSELTENRNLPMFKQYQKEEDQLQELFDIMEERGYKIVRL